jgi:HEAT repeats
MPLLNANLLIKDIASGDEKRRQEATEIIAELDHDTDVDVAVFVSSLSSKDDDVVFWCMIALEHLGDRGSSAVPKLLSLLEREELFFRQSAVKTLAAVGAKDEVARAAVFRAFADSSPFVRREALQACIRIPQLSADELDRIAAMAADPDEAVSSWSEITLRNIRLNKQARA